MYNTNTKPKFCICIVICLQCYDLKCQMLNWINCCSFIKLLSFNESKSLQKALPRHRSRTLAIFVKTWEYSIWIKYFKNDWDFFLAQFSLPWAEEFFKYLRVTAEDCQFCETLTPIILVRNWQIRKLRIFSHPHNSREHYMMTFLKVN